MSASQGELGDPWPDLDQVDATDPSTAQPSEKSQGLDDEARAARNGFVERAVKTWSGQLVDLSGRNNLLYYRDLKVGSLPLDDCDQALLFDALEGRPVLLSALFPAEAKREDAVKRARAVRNKASAHYEERGLETLYLAVGMATWTPQKSASTPAAPVLLVPIRLAAKGAAQEEFELTVTGELEVNPTFLHMLNAEFEISCDPGELLASSGIEGVIDTPEELALSYQWLREKCQTVPGFEVGERFVIGNFSYAKLPMVRDLEGASEALAEHDLIAALAGDPAAQKELRQAGAGAEIANPDFTPPADEFLVLDADSSQNHAINAVLAGRSLIIKGPPGTGKSQTISNLISTLVARGKRVLFVAEKRAAIDAVLKRLEEVGLSDLILDLHGAVSSRRATAQALASALSHNARLGVPEVEGVHRRLEQRRGELVSRDRALHDVREPWEASFYEVLSRLLVLSPQASSELRFRGAQLEALGADAKMAADEDLEVLIRLGGLRLGRSDSPWAKATVVSPEQALALQARVESLRSDLDALIERLRAAASQSGLAQPSEFGTWRELLELWSRAQSAQELFAEDVFALDLPSVLHDCEPMERSAAARFSAAIANSAYRAARNQLRSQLRAGARPSPHLVYAAATDAASLLRRWAELRLGDSSLPRPCEDLTSLTESYERVAAQTDALATDLGVGCPEETAAIRNWLDALLADVDTLGRLPECHRLRTNLEGLGLQPLLVELEARVLDAERAKELFEFAWLSSLREHLQLSDPRLGNFDGEAQAAAVEEFQASDREHIETTPQRVRRRCAEAAVAAQDADEQGAALIKSEAAKKRKHLPIRQLFSAAPEVMTTLKPCWVMSPLIVSQVLPHDRPHFDVVVFDEASQVRPAEAIPAILRGRQLVVAGDERQLPPTDFFSGSNVEIEAEEDHEAALRVDSSFESILEAMDPFVGFRMLEWHYRSRDERLIAFSNAYLYDRSLTTFPGISGPDCIRHVEVPFDPTRAGSTASSDAEVERVVELILEHAELEPQLSLGVIAMGSKHAERIEECLRAELGERDDLEEFFAENRDESFFIKNLERVQGDERDTIILSVGYGKNEDGRLLYRFGPLNIEGGERRLNVAVTRAKERMILVSSFSHLDMDPSRSSARGVELLRAYLEYCASGGSKIGEILAQTPELNPFEIDIRDRLQEAGLALEPQFGSSGYRIDFAVKHPRQPGRMVLAIECDGASYHSAPSARDRDRLRQEQLERLGWRFHRIWSQDWFSDKQSEVERAKAAYAEALVAAERLDAADLEDAAPPERDRAALAEDPPEDLGAELVHLARRKGPSPVGRPDGVPITSYSAVELQALIRWIESDGLLRSKSDLREEAIEALGFRRRGPRIIAAIDQAIAMTRDQ